VSGIAVAIVTTTVWDGPTIASYIPRCMAGNLTAARWFDLFLEGVYDTPGKFGFVGIRWYLAHYHCHDVVGYEGWP
jgi:SulP family sulfate permease